MEVKMFQKCVILILGVRQGQFLTLNEQDLTDSIHVM